ncbi:Non-reducing end alpha-L-arabinofuranosidase BoGH43B [Podospora fimiseda]|uniref:Non-reducing end alpha-L-arabinofuranosidase BoGH43B n=1 Tax=Podospora fimiseda TaxID=252190 RepID=A0AAN7BZY5_9PEZI|nr:Non-reducing end alpha-L-arabinofuranosidase BoGH43B [Podospora fimiseda]
MFWTLITLLTLSLLPSPSLTKNSTLHNPIFPGFHPDPSCIFLPHPNQTFYCVSSSFNAFPGIPIHSSQDLQNWHLIGHVLNRKEQLPRLAETNRSTSGIWAPTLRYKDGVFWVTTTLVNDHLPQTEEDRWDNIIFSSSGDISDDASWSEAKHFELVGYDPELFWDENTGKTYVNAAHAWQVGAYIVQNEIDLSNGGELIGEWRVIWNGTGGLAPEGPHIYFVDGLYYLLAAEGGTGVNHMVTMARSKSVQGPFEGYEGGNPVLTNANTSSYFQTVGHADLFEDAKGNWWAVALATRSGPEYLHYPMGRETVLTAVRWEKGGFPIFTPVSGEMSVWPLPVSADTISPESINSDAEELLTFGPGTNLPKHLVHWRYPNPDHFAVSPEGHENTLRLFPSNINLTGLNGNYAGPEGQSFVGRRQQHTLFTFSVDLDFTPTDLEEEAGVTAFLTQNHHLDLGIVLLPDQKTGENKLTPHLRFRGESYLPVTKEVAVPVEEEWRGKTLTLEIRARNETHFEFGFGLKGGGDIKIVAVSGNEVLSWGFTGALLGVYCTNNGNGGTTPGYFSNWSYVPRGQFRG